MKEKVIKGIIIAVIVISVLGLAFWVSTSYGTGNGSSVNFEFNDITIDEYLELMKSEEPLIIYVARPTCSFCQKQQPIIKKVGGKYNLDINYLNTEEFWDYEKEDYTEDGYKFINSNQVYIDEGGFGTPNTLIVQNGKVVDAIYQLATEQELVNLFNKYGFINE